MTDKFAFQLRLTLNADNMQDAEKQADYIVELLQEKGINFFDEMVEGEVYTYGS